MDSNNYNQDNGQNSYNQQGGQYNNYNQQNGQNNNYNQQNGQYNNYNQQNGQYNNYNQQQGGQYNNYGQQPNQMNNPNGYNYQYGGNNMNQQTPGGGYAIASMVCGILSIVVCWCYGVIGLILGIVALIMTNLYKKSGARTGDGMAKAGFVCGIIGSSLSAIYLILVVAGCVWGRTVNSLYWYKYL